MSIYIKPDSNGIWHQLRVLADYKNGNEHVVLFDDGTKIRETDDDEFCPEFPENCDMTISTVCDNGCRFCYMNCTPNGQFADFSKYPFLKSMFPGMEVAINLNFPVHPDLLSFLTDMKKQGVFVNATVNENHFMENREMLHDLTAHDLIHGIGISYTGANDNTAFVDAVHEFPNAVIHTIAGLIDETVIDNLRGHSLKLLILGYKDIGRGLGFHEDNSDSIQKNIDWLRDILPKLTGGFQLISFDNLALSQLHVKEWVNDRTWEERYQGEEGTMTFYLDLVHGTYARDSLIGEHFPIGDKSLKEMFQDIRGRYAKKI